MARYLSTEWFELARRLAADEPAPDDASARVQCIVTGGPDGEIRHHLVLEDGRLVEWGLGDVVRPDCVLTLPYEESTSVDRGALDPSVAFMQGRLKTTGSAGSILGVLRLASSRWAVGLRARLREHTEY